MLLITIDALLPEVFCSETLSWLKHIFLSNFTFFMSFSSILFSLSLHSRWDFVGTFRDKDHGKWTVPLLSSTINRKCPCLCFDQKSELPGIKKHLFLVFSYIKLPVVGCTLSVMPRCQSIHQFFLVKSFGIGTLYYHI